MNVWQSFTLYTNCSLWWGKFFIKEAGVRRENSPTPANASPHLLQQWPLLTPPLFCSIWIFPSLNKSATVSDSVRFNKTGEGFTLTLCLTEVLNDPTKKKKAAFATKYATAAAANQTRLWMDGGSQNWPRWGNYGQSQIALCRKNIAFILWEKLLRERS